MKKISLLFFALFTFLLVPSEVYPQQVLVLIHDTTIVTSQLKRLADKDTLKEVLSAILPSYVLETIDSNSTLSNLSSYKSIILQETSFDATQCRYLGVAGRNAIKTWLNSGTPGDKRTLVSIGADQAYNYSRTGSAARDLDLSQNLLKFTYRVDSGTLTGQISIVGVAIDAGNTRSMTNTPIGSGYWPDGVQPLSGSTVLYRYSGRTANDTVAAVGVNETNYLGISLFQDPRYFINNDFLYVLLEALQWAVANGGTFPGLVPVELTSFAATVIGTDVRLSWITSSELNNLGFEIERSENKTEWQNIGFVEGHGTSTEMKYYSYTDSEMKTGIYYYRIKQIDFDGSFSYSSVVEAEVIIPMQFALNQNYPNPFNPSTKINFSLPADSKVMLKIFDILGQEVVTLFSGELSAGEHQLDFNAAGLNSGVYLYKLDAQGVNGKNFSSVKKMILSK